MASTSNNCPSLEQLSAFLVGSLDDESATQLERHISECSSCIDSLRRINEDDPFVDKIRVSGRSLDEKDSVTGSSADFSVRYTDLTWLARGGMGEVWIASDNFLKRRVAMKVIQPRFVSNAEVVKRFLNEAEITSGLEHPGIAPVYGMGSHSDGRPCYAMRYVRGESMGDAIRKFFSKNGDPIELEPSFANPNSTLESATPIEDLGRRSLDIKEIDRRLAFRSLLQKFISVCQTVAYAHQHGVLHRDLKPENIRLGEHGEVILLDWGLAKQLGNGFEDVSSDDPLDDTNSPSEFLRTKVGSIYGTPQFMSPEQARGDGKPITTAADIYGLGATLYYMLTGRAPFPRESPSRIVQRVIHGEFDPPSKVCGDIPRSLNAICIKAMQTSPESRYQSASELASEIERFLADEPVKVLVEPISDRLARIGRKHRGVVTAILASSILITIGSVLASPVTGSATQNTKR